MRQQRHVLKHHADVAGAHLAQRPVAERQDVLAEDIHPAGGRFDQAVEVTYQRGLTRPGQPHDTEYFAALDTERTVGDADNAAELGEDFGLGQTA